MTSPRSTLAWLIIDWDFDCRMVKIYTKLHKSMEILEYFTTRSWDWTHANLDALKSSMTPEDQKVSCHGNGSWSSWQIVTASSVVVVWLSIMLPLCCCCCCLRRFALTLVWCTGQPTFRTTVLGRRNSFWKKTRPGSRLLERTSKSKRTVWISVI